MRKTGETTDHVAVCAGAAEPASRSTWQTALGGLLGNVVEWFDFAVYGYFAGDIGRHFFPQSSPTAQQLLTFTVFALGFATRPIGSLVFGAIGDRVGRRPLLTLSIGLMGGTTLLIGLLPTYAQIGVAAPLLLMTLRLLQGFSVGGEFTGSMVYTTERASIHRRGIVSSSTAAGTTLGFILGSASAWLVTASLGAEQASAWGWRIPFVASVALCIAGWLLRRGIEETTEGRKAAAIGRQMRLFLLEDWRPLVQTFGIVAMTNAAYYLTFTYAVERRKQLAGDGGEIFLLVNTISLLVVLFAKPLGGWLSDIVGRRRLMIVITLVTMSLVGTALRAMLYGSPKTFIAGQVLMGVPLGMALGLQGAMLVEIFPLRSRVTSMSFAYSVTLALVGGTSPLVAGWLIDALNEPLAPAWYILLYGVMGLMVMWRMPETNARQLDR